MTSRPGDRGSVTAEFAIALPAAVLVLALGAATLAACAHQVRLQDAAADAARLTGRGDADRGLSIVADAGGTASVSRGDDLVCVTASARAAVPLVAVTLRARACALDESALDGTALDEPAPAGAADRTARTADGP
jgi:hypothetical protein